MKVSTIAERIATAVCVATPLAVVGAIYLGLAMIFLAGAVRATRLILGW